MRREARRTNEGRYLAAADFIPASKKQKLACYLSYVLIITVGGDVQLGAYMLRYFRNADGECKELYTHICMFIGQAGPVQ